MNDLDEDELTLTIRAVREALMNAEQSGHSEKASILRSALDKLE